MKENKKRMEKDKIKEEGETSEEEKALDEKEEKKEEEEIIEEKEEEKENLEDKKKELKRDKPPKKEEKEEDTHNKILKNIFITFGIIAFIGASAFIITNSARNFDYKGISGHIIKEG